VSKVLPTNASFDGTLRACERSLKRLRVDYLDLYLLHWKGSHPIDETMRAMEALVARKQIRYIGVSNFDVPDVQDAERALRHERLACNQVLYHLGDRGIERKLIPYCRRQEIAVVAYSPLGSGKFPSPRRGAGKTLKQVADRHQASRRQVTLNFLTRHEGVFAIPKAAKLEHTRENSAALDFILSEDDLAATDRAFPAPDHDVPLGMI
jgi:diketogulonate reductase-like aldo/keto reductase